MLGSAIRCKYINYIIIKTVSSTQQAVLLLIELSLLAVQW